MYLLILALGGGRSRSGAGGPRGGVGSGGFAGVGRTSRARARLAFSWKRRNCGEGVFGNRVRFNMAG